MKSISFDLIVITRTMDVELRNATQRTIDSCISGVRFGSKVNVIIVETSGLKCNDYKNYDEMLLYKGQFMYNKALNLGLTKAKGDIHILANNDLFFHEGWDEIGQLMFNNNYLSACALSQDKRQAMYKKGYTAYEGYRIGRHLPGWCIFMRKEVLKIIGKLPEKHEFWYSDDDYADILKYYKIKHALICAVRVDHVHNGSTTLAKIDKFTRQRYTSGRK